MLAVCILGMFLHTDTPGAILADSAIEGKFVVTHADRDGKADDFVADAIIECKPGKYTLTLKRGKVLEGEMKLQPGVSPKTFDVIPSGGPHKGETLLGIYKNEEGVLTMAYSEPGGPRPKDFTSKEGVIVVTYKRAK